MATCWEGPGGAISVGVTAGPGLEGVDGAGAWVVWAVMDGPKGSGVNLQGRGTGTGILSRRLKEPGQGRSLGIGTRVSLVEMDQEQTLALRSLGSLACRCPVPEVL